MEKFKDFTVFYLEFDYAITLWQYETIDW
jgi:hypothetical protein